MCLSLLRLRLFCFFLFVLKVSCFAIPNEYDRHSGHSPLSRRLQSHSASSSSSSRSRSSSSSSSSSSDETSGFEILRLPGGICGTGGEYQYLKRAGDPRYVALVLLGDGFCFDEASCLAGVGDTILEERITLKLGLLAGSDFVTGMPFSNEHDGISWTIIAAPQCTEDGHLGNNVAYLGATLPEFHFKGGHNVDLLVRAELEQGDLLADMRHFVLWGTSSAAYGAAAWGHALFALPAEGCLKTLVLDSLMLHHDLFAGIFLASGLVGEDGYDLANSRPFASAEMRDRLFTGDISMASLVEFIQEEYCDVYVASLLWDYETELSDAHARVLNVPALRDLETWKAFAQGSLLPQNDGFDTKRSSTYVANGSNHVFLTPDSSVAESEIATGCPNAPTAQEYVARVIGGKDEVRRYYGNNRRIQTFPKYSWNSYDIECLEGCNGDDDSDC